MRSVSHLNAVAVFVVLLRFLSIVAPMQTMSSSLATDKPLYHCTIVRSDPVHQVHWIDLCIPVEHDDRIALIS